MDGVSSGRVAVVTGASSGIGEATALALAARGWSVMLVGRRRDELERVAATIGAGPGRAVVAALDAADGTAVLAMAERVTREHGVPDLIVHSAGAGRWRFVEETTPSEAVEMMNAPYFAAFNVTHAFMAGMLARRRGQLVHIDSAASIVPWPGATGYTATRWALRGLHEALLQDLRGTGVRSLRIVFGEVSSQYFVHNPGSHERIPGIGRTIPVTSPERCARVILRVVGGRRKLVVYPFMLRFYRWLYLIAPGPVRWLVGVTGWQRR
ncbi:MAG TPA: SDR family NAD(P)-dependent oxidoreductase [Acidimicrobiia bacterium]|nr:SDR family NAD(P)-dependent oxidoreductase [Acidimicrobiia bacterium]